MRRISLWMDKSRHNIDLHSDAKTWPTNLESLKSHKNTAVSPIFWVPNFSIEAKKNKKDTPIRMKTPLKITFYGLIFLAHVYTVYHIQYNAGFMEETILAFTGEFMTDWLIAHLGIVLYLIYD